MRSRCPAPALVADLVRRALREDIGSGDITTRLTIPRTALASARVVARQDGVCAGIGICARVFQTVDRPVGRERPTHCVRFSRQTTDGCSFRAGETLATVSGPAQAVLTAERTALNFLQRLCGVATLTRSYVDAVQGTRARIMDTRKTTPGWRELEKYAVRCGGGMNHRLGLYDMVLVKDNHIAAAGGIAAALERCRRVKRPVEIEVRSIGELREALAAGAKRVLLDNMSLAQMRRAVETAGGRALLEASGGVTLGRVRRIAATGVDFISVGALTHSAPAVDIALEVSARTQTRKGS